MPRTTHPELHRTERIGWLRAAVLGTNDGIVSTASLMLGVAAASTGQNELLIEGAAALVAGAMSMAAGEYVSVASQAATFAAGAALPLLTAWLAPPAQLTLLVAGISLLCLTGLGALFAQAGGARVLQASARVAFGGALAMGLTAGVGKLFGAVYA